MKNIKKHAPGRKDDPETSTKEHLAIPFFGRHKKGLEEVASIVKSAFMVFKSQYATPEASTTIDSMADPINSFSSDIDACVSAGNEECGISSQTSCESKGCPHSDGGLLEAEEMAIKRYWDSKLQPWHDIYRQCDYFGIKRHDKAVTMDQLRTAVYWMVLGNS
eukprot:gene21197-23279_t